MLRARAERSPDCFAVRDRYRRLTYRELRETVDAFAALLSRHGIKRGQRVTLWMPDRIETVVALIACSRNGLVCCPSPHGRHTVAEVVELMERMRGAAFIYQAGFGADADRRDVEDALGHLGSLRHVLRLAPNGPVVPEAPLFDGALGEAPGPDDGPPPSNDPDGVTYLAFTSGSTGSPKGVMHSDNTLLLTARAISADWRIGPDTVVYSMSPFCHNLGIGSLLTSLVGGAELVIHDLARGESLVDRLIETGTSYLVGVPTHAVDLLAEMRDRGLGALGRGDGFRSSGACQCDARLLEDQDIRVSVKERGLGSPEGGDVDGFQECATIKVRCTKRSRRAKEATLWQVCRVQGLNSKWESHLRGHGGQCGQGWPLHRPLARQGRSVLRGAIRHFLQGGRVDGGVIASMLLPIIFKVVESGKGVLPTFGGRAA